MVIEIRHLHLVLSRLHPAALGIGTAKFLAEICGQYLGRFELAQGALPVRRGNAFMVVNPGLPNQLSDLRATKRPDSRTIAAMLLRSKSLKTREESGHGRSS